MDLIGIANRQVSILHVCRLLDMRADYDIKIYCPFGRMYHRDDGMTAAFRVYADTNSANCFAGCGYFSPVTLYGRAKGLESMEAADELLDSVGYDRNDVAKRWDKIMGHTPEIDVENLSAALQLYCSRISPQWDDKQYEPKVAGKLNACLGLLDKVSNLEQAQLWLAACKTAMSRALAE